MSAGDPIGFTDLRHEQRRWLGVQRHRQRHAADPGRRELVDRRREQRPGLVDPSGVLKYGPATLASGATVKVHVTSATAPATCGKVDNTATVTTSNAGTDTDSASVVVLCPDVTVEKTADDSPILAGAAASYTITVKNVGPGLAKAVTLSDPLPGAGIAWSEDSEACSIEDATLTCAFGDLEAGESVVIHVSGTTSVEDCGQLPNIATVAAANEAAEDQANDQSSATIVVQCAGISLVKTAGTAADGEDYVTEPGSVTFTYIVTNTSSAALIGIDLVDDNATPDDASDDFAVMCPKTTLAAGESMTCSATADVDFGVRTNIAVVTGHPVIQPEASVSDTDDAVVRVPQLTIEKSFTGNTKGTDAVLGIPAAAEGDVLTYTLAYDLTDGPVTDGVITDVLPEGLEYLFDSAQGNDEFAFTDYDPNTRTLRWDAETVSKDGTVTYQVTVQREPTSSRSRSATSRRSTATRPRPTTMTRTSPSRARSSTSRRRRASPRRPRTSHRRRRATRASTWCSSCWPWAG